MSFANVAARISASAITMLADAGVSWQPFGESTVYTCRGLFSEPGLAVLDDAVITEDFSIGYLASELPGLKRGEILSITRDGETEAANWKVREIMPNGHTARALLLREE